MAERERRITPPFGGVFVPHKRVMDADDVARATVRIAHEVIERNHGLEQVAVIGLQTGGVPLAERLVEAIERIDGRKVPIGTLDVAFYRDDIGIRPVLPEAVTDIEFSIDGATVVLVDDVLFTGPHDPSGAERAERLRTAPLDPARGDGRSRPSRAADPPGLRRQEPSDSARRDGRRER